MTLIDQDTVENWLTTHPLWRLEDDKLCASLQFEDFNTAWGFISRTALIAEHMNHHPEWCNSYSRVELVLTTHDAGGLTDKDIALAEALDKILV